MKRFTITSTIEVEATDLEEVDRFIEAQDQNLENGCLASKLIKNVKIDEMEDSDIILDQETEI